MVTMYGSNIFFKSTPIFFFFETIDGLALNFPRKNSTGLTKKNIGKNIAVMYVVLFLQEDMEWMKCSHGCVYYSGFSSLSM